VQALRAGLEIFMKSLGDEHPSPATVRGDFETVTALLSKK